MYLITIFFYLHFDYHKWTTDKVQLAICFEGLSISPFCEIWLSDRERSKVFKGTLVAFLRAMRIVGNAYRVHLRQPGLGARRSVVTSSMTTVKFT